MRRTSDWLRASFDDYSSVSWLEPFSPVKIYRLLWSGMIEAKKSIGFIGDDLDDDCVQNGFIYLHRKAANYDGQVKPGTYVALCGRWATLDTLRQRQRQEARRGEYFTDPVMVPEVDEKIDTEICLAQLFAVADARMRIILQDRLAGETIRHTGYKLGVSGPRVSHLFTEFKQRVRRKM